MVQTSMDVTVFEFTQYKDYLVERLGGIGKRKGLRLAIARALQCQPTFVSQVLNGHAHFSLEQAEKISRFFGHSEDEQEYFFLLIQKERSGTAELKRYHAQKIAQLLGKRQILTHRLGKDAVLSRDEQSIYYSSWHYAAIHIAVTIPALRSREALADFFRVPQGKVGEILDYLTSTRLIVRAADGYNIGLAKIRLGNDSHNILRHHSNWRTQVLDALDREGPADLHYSAVISLSKADATRIKDAILDQLKKNLKITDASAEEELFCYCVDFFNLKR
jgi:uncharacterized protein (TIGR02147 family)